jgi:hypothetical protein
MLRFCDVRLTVPAVRRRPSPASTSARGVRARSGSVTALSLTVAVLATLVAVPIALNGRETGAVEVHAVLATEPSDVTTPLLDDVDSDDLFEAGARDDAPSILESDRAASFLSDTIPADDPGESSSNAVGSGFDQTDTVTQRDASPSTTSTTSSKQPKPPLSTAVPTTAVPTTPPSTAVPTTEPPSTAAPLTEPPSTTPSEDDASAAAATESAPDETAAPAPTTPSQPSAAQWAALRQCEAGGSYTIVSGNGLYHGAYQFHRQTWDKIAQSAGRGDLVGVLPNQASPSDQDAMALFLWNQSGWSPWPTCGRAAAAAV